MSEKMPAPVAEALGPPRSGLRWATLAIAGVTAGLVLFNAEAGRNWADGLPPTPLNEKVRTAVDGWADLTARVGLSSARTAVRSLWERRGELQWPGRARPPQT